MDSSLVSSVIVGVAIVVGILVLVWLVITLIGIRVIGSNQVGVVEKWWSTGGSLKDKIIAVEGEAGYQPDVLRSHLTGRSHEVEFVS